jgi:dTDP-4-dehydrorhamnose reductase
MRILLFGASGLLGKVLQEEWGSDEIIPATSREADIRSEEQVRKLFFKCRPEWTILAAAYTDVDACENNSALAHAVNFRGAINVAQAARENNSRFLLISTDYVFDGTKSTPYEVDDPIRPLNVYGRSKAAAEQGVRDILPGCCILRTSWLFGAIGKCFPNSILALARERKTLSVVTDQTGSPTFNRDLARVIRELVRAGAAGTIHAANSGNCSWFEFAQEILRAGVHADVQLVPISTQELRRPAPRPRYSVLSCKSLAPFGISLRSWKEALPVYLQEFSALKHATGKASSPATRQVSAQS